MKIKQTGFSVVELIIIIVVLAGIGLIGYKVFGSKESLTKENHSSNANPANEVTSNQPGQLIWQQTEGGWQSTETPPNCPNQPILNSPVDLSKVTSVLYPGQNRGGNYKPHGGFRFDNIKDNVVSVYAPIDGYIVRGGSYLAEGEVQYTFDVMNNCGIMYRVGHLRELPQKLKSIADSWPKPTANSATQSLNPAPLIKQGEIVGTKIGIIKTNNTFFDFGVYDFRQPNEASNSANYKTAHSEDRELSWHAVCWLKDWLPSKDTAVISLLPAADPTSGKNSDYCN